QDSPGRSWIECFDDFVLSSLYIKLQQHNLLRLGLHQQICQRKEIRLGSHHSRMGLGPQIRIEMPGNAVLRMTPKPVPSSPAGQPDGQNFRTRNGVALEVPPQPIAILRNRLQTQDAAFEAVGQNDRGHSNIGARINDHAAASGSEITSFQLVTIVVRDLRHDLVERSPVIAYYRRLPGSERKIDLLDGYDR